MQNDNKVIMIKSMISPNVGLVSATLSKESEKNDYSPMALTKILRA